MTTKELKDRLEQILTAKPELAEVEVKATLFGMSNDVNRHGSIVCVFERDTTPPTVVLSFEAYYR